MSRKSILCAVILCIGILCASCNDSDEQRLNSQVVGSEGQGSVLQKENNKAQEVLPGESLEPNGRQRTTYFVEKYPNTLRLQFNDDSTALYMWGGAPSNADYDYFGYFVIDQNGAQQSKDQLIDYYQSSESYTVEDNYETGETLVVNTKTGDVECVIEPLEDEEGELNIRPQFSGFIADNIFCYSVQATQESHLEKEGFGIRSVDGKINRFYKGSFEMHLSETSLVAFDLANEQTYVVNSDFELDELRVPFFPEMRRALSPDGKYLLVVDSFVNNSRVAFQCYVHEIQSDITTEVFLDVIEKSDSFVGIAPIAISNGGTDIAISDGSKIYWYSS